MSKVASRRKFHESSVELSERDGVRSLHLGSDLVQSAMRLSHPDDLEIAYTRCMMSFLLFNRAPKEILMIGLGGGSLAKFVYHRIPATRMVAVEISPQVVAAATSFFFLPPEDERFRVVIGDGAEYVATHPESCDILMVDGYEDGRLPAALSSRAFYGDVAAALTPRGIMVANLLGRDRRLPSYLDRIGDSFPGGLFRLEDGDYGNVIVLAFRKAPPKRWREKGVKLAVELENGYGLPFTRYVTELGQNG